MEKGKQYKEILEKETDMFMSIANKEDIEALILHKEEDGIEDIVRISVITIVFEFKELYLKILSQLEEEEVKKYIGRLKEIKTDFETINKWVTEFIKKSVSEEFRSEMLPYWEDYAKGVDRETFSLGDYFKSGKII